MASHDPRARDGDPVRRAPHRRGRQAGPSPARDERPTGRAGCPRDGLPARPLVTDAADPRRGGRPAGEHPARPRRDGEGDRVPAGRPGCRRLGRTAGARRRPGHHWGSPLSRPGDGRRVHRTPHGTGARRGRLHRGRAGHDRHDAARRARHPRAAALGRTAGRDRPGRVRPPARLGRRRRRQRSGRTQGTGLAASAVRVPDRREPGHHGLATTGLRRAAARLSGPPRPVLPHAVVRRPGPACRPHPARRRRRADQRRQRPRPLRGLQPHQGAARLGRHPGDQPTSVRIRPPRLDPASVAAHRQGHHPDRTRLRLDGPARPRHAAPPLRAPDPLATRTPRTPRASSRPPSRSCWRRWPRWSQRPEVFTADTGFNIML